MLARRQEHVSECLCCPTAAGRDSANITLRLLSDDVDDRQPWQNKSKSATEIVKDQV
jgi:hypothetical protein